MSESVQETFLASVADNIADTFFGDSRNVISPSDVKTDVLDKTKEVQEVPKKQEPLKNEGIKNLNVSLSAEDLVGDLLEKPAPEEPEYLKSTETVPAQPKEKPILPHQDYAFLVEKGVLAGFEDDSPVKTKDDLEKLIMGNKEMWQQEAKDQAVKDEFGTLPDQIKLLIDYAKNGGQDFQTVFGLLAQNQQVRNYDPEKAEDQRAIIRDYYSTQGWTEDEIEEEIISLVEGEKLKSQSNKLKPKLDKMNQTFLDEQTEQQKVIAEQKKKADQFFVNTVVETLEKGKVGEIKLSKEDQQDIYRALVSETYQSFGRKTNRLGALLDKIQYVEPDYDLLAEVTMLLSDKAAYHKKIRDAVNTEVSAQTVKKIKIDQNKQKINSNYNAEKDTEKLPKLRSGFINPFE